MIQSDASTDNAARRRRAVFLDRDGTLNVDRGYVYRREDFEWIPGAVESIRRLNESGLPVVVVTNQGGVGHGYYSEADVRALHRFMTAELAKSGARVDAWYYCPYHPDSRVEAYRRDDTCRKPNPGMIEAAAAEHGIDVAASYLVGDKVSDIEAGRRAGATTILVRTGYGREHERAAGADFAVDDISEAVEVILGLR